MIASPRAAMADALRIGTLAAAAAAAAAGHTVCTRRRCLTTEASWMKDQVMMCRGAVSEVWRV